MSKTSIVSGILSIVLVVGAYVAFTKSVQKALHKEEPILLYVEEGDVSFKDDGASSFEKATTSPVAISNNTMVYTGLGKATILFPNNSNVTLDHYTELAVHYDGTKTSFYQTLGTTYHRVESLVTGSTYEVETPGTVASVRGTKFAVRYDKKKKITKVAVTEHNVFVAKIVEVTENGTTTKKMIESANVDEGKTAKVEEEAKATSTISLGGTDQDEDMNTWVEENKSRDTFQEKIKEENSSKDDVRDEIKSALLGKVHEGEGSKDDNKNSSRKTEVETKKGSENETEDKKTGQKNTTEHQDDRKVPEQTKEGKQTDTEQKSEQKIESGSTTQSSTQQTTSTKKVDYDTFFDKFNTLFVDYFYLDENDTPCTKNVSASERVRIVSSYASESGYPFSTGNLIEFAQSINAYCSSKDAATKARLQSRFDVVFPYQEDI